MSHGSRRTTTGARNPFPPSRVAILSGRNEGWEGDRGYPVPASCMADPPRQAVTATDRYGYEWALRRPSQSHPMEKMDGCPLPFTKPKSLSRRPI